MRQSRSAARSAVLASGLLVFVMGIAAAPGLGTGGASGKTTAGPRGELLFTSMRTGASQIFRIDADGGRESRLTQTQSSELQPVWSRQGRIAFVSMRSGGGDIYTMDANGGDLRRVTSRPGLEQSPAWSPDGKRIAYVGERDGRTELRVARVDGDQDTVVSPNLSEVGAPEWSPDGMKIAFVATIKDKLRVLVANLDSGAVGVVTDGAGGEFGPTWSPDGSAIVYVQSGSRTEGVNLRIVRIGSPTSAALTSGGYTNSQPLFSPDGTKVLYLSNSSSQGGTMNVHVMNADGAGVSNLTRWEHADLSATWSSDGRHVFFMSFRDWPGQIYRVEADGKDLQRLTYSNAQDGFPLGRPSDRALAVQPPIQ